MKHGDLNGNRIRLLWEDWIVDHQMLHPEQRMAACAGFVGACKMLRLILEKESINAPINP